MAGHSTWRVTGSRITGAVPEEVRAGQSRPPDLACTGQMRSSGQFRHAASSSFTASVTLEIRSAASTAVIQVSSRSPCRPQPGVSRGEFGHDRVGFGNLRERAAVGVE